MNRIIYIIAIILIIIWAIGFFAYTIGAIIHLLLITAMILILIRISGLKRRKNRNETSLRDYRKSNRF